MITFQQWVEAFDSSPSMRDDEGDGLDRLVPKLITKKHPGAMPVYDSSELPPTAKTGWKSKKLSHKK